MRATQLHTICIMTLATALLVGFEAQASLDPNMEAGVACADSDCMFRGMPQVANEPVARMQRLSLFQIEGEEPAAKLYKVNRYADNPAVTVDRAAFPQFLPMNQIKNLVEVQSLKPGESAGRASGFNISPCLMVTNHHVVYGDDLQPVAGRDYTMLISAGIKAGAQFMGSTKQNHVEIAGARSEDGGNDYAVVKSPACLGKNFGWYEPSKKTPGQLVSEQAQVFVVSFPADRNEGQMEVSFGQVTGTEKETGNLQYNASTAPGSSGGAVFIMENGEMRLVGLHVGGKRDGKRYEFDTHTQKYTNTFIPVRDILGRDDVQKMVELDKQFNGSTNKAAAFFKSSPDVKASKSTGRLTI
jgi:V8-like Glu-specific endopeptidase